MKRKFAQVIDLPPPPPLGMMEYVNMRPLPNAVLQQRILFVINLDSNSDF